MVSLFYKDDVERAGLVKVDFLGLKTLTIIDWAVKSVNKYRQTLGEEPVEIESIPLDDRGTFEQLRRGDTTGIFQLESRGMKDLIRRLLPENIDDINTYFRPGKSLANAEGFTSSRRVRLIKAKNGFVF